MITRLNEVERCVEAIMLARHFLQIFAIIGIIYHIYFDVFVARIFYFCNNFFLSFLRININIVVPYFVAKYIYFLVLILWNCGRIVTFLNN